jgi:nitrate/nitrite transporter NarK
MSAKGGGSWWTSVQRQLGGWISDRFIVKPIRQLYNGCGYNIAIVIYIYTYNEFTSPIINVVKPLKANVTMGYSNRLLG